jgi:hypothetical protein
MRHTGRQRCLLWTAVCLLVLTFAGATFADGEYRAAMRRAVAAKEKALDSNLPQDWAETLKQLRIADAIRTTAESKYEIGVAASRLDQEDIAVESYTAALELGLAAAASAKARNYITEYALHLAQIRIEGPDGARILLNGIERAQLPNAKAIFIAPGSVVLQAITEDKEPTTRNLTLAEGRVEVVSLNANERQQDSLPPPTSKEPETQTRSLGSKATANVHGQNSMASSPSRPSPHSSSSRDAWLSKTRTGKLLLVAGATMSVLSVSFIAISNHEVSASRKTLLGLCAVQTEGPDTCAHARAGQWDSAQSASNSIATWKVVRTTSWVGLVTGVAAMIGGTAVLVRANSSAPESPPQAHLALTPDAFLFSYARSF